MVEIPENASVNSSIVFCLELLIKFFDIVLYSLIL
jgi:hypothetical protein